MTPTTTRLFAAVAALSLVAAACGGDDDDTGAEPATDSVAAPPTVPAAAPELDPDEPTTLTLVTYDSFPAPDPENPLHQALADFTEQTGYDVDLLVAGDTGTMLTKAELTAGNPEGDVLWGIDNTFLSRAVDSGVFEPYESTAVADLPSEFTALVPNGEATPVDFGDVCVNYDIAALEAAGVTPPETLDDLAEPEYGDLLVVQNPASSSPGLAFLLATIAEYGDGWESYWESLVANGVEVVDSWTNAYYESFSWAGGDRPLVVSYGSSPPFEVLYGDGLDTPPTGVAEGTCFRQVEFAGVLAGTDSPTGARLLIDFLISERFQREVPLNLFVFPANPAAELDPVFTDFATIPDAPLSLDPADIATNRSDWIDRWTEIAS